MTQHLYLSQIRTALPDLPIERLEQTGGQFADVMVVNGKWVFRFPRTRDGVARMIAETGLLNALQDRLPLPIPRPAYQRFDPPIPGLAFLGYRRLPGEPLENGALAAVRGDDTHDDLARQLAEFLRALHAVPLAELPAEFPGRGPSDPPADQRPAWEAMYAAVRESLAPAMRSDARRAVDAHFESYLDDPALQSFIPCLRHGDFGGSNILWEPQSTPVRISAVVDFSSCAPGDPAYDLASIATLGSDFLERVAAHYAPDPAGRAPLLARAAFYQGTFALQEALAGLRDRDQAAYLHGMENYV